MLLDAQETRAHVVEVGFCIYYLKALSRGVRGLLLFRGDCGRRGFELLHKRPQVPLEINVKEVETGGFVHVSGDLREGQVFCLKCTELRANPGCMPRKLFLQIVLTQGAFLVFEEDSECVAVNSKCLDTSYTRFEKFVDCFYVVYLRCLKKDF